MKTFNGVAFRAMCVIVALGLCSATGTTVREKRQLESDFWSQLSRRFSQFEDAAVKEAEKMGNVFRSVFGADSETEADDLEGNVATSSIDRDREPLEDTDTDIMDPEISSPVFPGDLFNFFGPGFGRLQPWWKGPNVCVEREEIDEGKEKNNTSNDDSEFGVIGTFQFSSCQQTRNKYVCTTKIRNHGIRKSFVVKYQCCHGYRRVEGKPGCTEVNLKSMLDTASDLGARDFVQLIKTHGLEEKFSSNNLTLFAPSDEAVQDFSDTLEETNQVDFYIPDASARKRRSTDTEGTSMKDVVLGHVTQGFYDINDIEDEQILYSDNKHSTIRMNIYPGPVVTANCAKITSRDNYATNGIVHIVDRVIRPSTRTLADILSGDERYSTFVEMLNEADLFESLKKPGHFTVFAPTVQAFEKLDPVVKAQIKPGQPCRTNLVKQHIVPHSVCSAAIFRRATTKNIAGDSLKLEREADTNKLIVSGVQITVKDIVATNGILHVLDEVIVTDSARPISNILANRNLTTFLDLLEDAGLTESIDSMKNVTLFVPTDEALANPKVAAKLEELKANKDRLRDVLLFHTTGPEVQTCDMVNDKELKSGLADRSLRINMYSVLPLFTTAMAKVTAECARVVHYDNKACGGTVHEIDKLILPPTGSVYDIIENDSKYSILKDVLQGTDLEEELKSNSPITLLAPVNEAFTDLDENELAKLKEDKKLAKRVLSQHILPENLCCAGVGGSTWPFTNRVETLNGHSVQVRRDYEGRVHIGSTTVKDCDIMATNGIVHSVNRVMVPREIKRNSGNPFTRIMNPNVEVLLYGI